MPGEKGGAVPVVQDFDSDILQARVSFAGVRRFPLLRSIPYMTGWRPSLKLKITLKNTRYRIDQILIESDSPMAARETVWQTKKVATTYDILLPILFHGGSYTYYLNVGLKYDGDTDIYVGDKIMTTGHVPYQENVTMWILSTFGAALLGGLVTYVVVRLLGCTP